MFQPVESQVSFPQLEEEILRFWKEQRIYEKSLALRSDGPAFVFYEGPPTANGLPHPGHCLTRAIKDLFPRYKTMRGYRCLRKAGWDTHGLPVEVEVCKELGIHSKEEIENYGVEPFIRKCLESVFRYTREWEELTERLGFWIRLDEAYVTFHQSYVESVWWALRTLFDRGLLYQGYKIVWWWAQGGTALSAGEVGQGYRQVADPAVYVRFPLLKESVRKLNLAAGGKDFSEVDLLIWTTTPWTLPSNQFAAVKADLEYAVVSIEGESRRLIIAGTLLEAVSGKVGKKFTVEAALSGRDLVGLRYFPPFRYYYERDGEKLGRLKGRNERQHLAWRVVPAEFVTVDTGTGVVHLAPAFGEVDFELLQQEQARFCEGEGPPLICSVAPDGTFTEETPEYQGRWVKDCDREIIRQLKEQNLLFHQEQYIHDYPFCWRAEEDPLIQYPRRSWFIRTTAFKEKMLANNRLINWLPEHIRDGRFGNFLETNVDWALSRERYWGTPLPIWQCSADERHMTAIASYEELAAKPGSNAREVWAEVKRRAADLPEHLKVHKPYIDSVEFDCEVPGCPGRMRRVPEVIDCWFDSGAMPFAQWGYPYRPDSPEMFRDQFPADFISEALDQTRGWFYSLLAISTLLFGEENGAGDNTPPAKACPPPPKYPFPHPFRNCIVLGLMLGEDGGKMSKQKRNYRDPDEIFRNYGADALRWYFFSNQPPWTSIRFSEQAIKDCIPEFLLRLWNVYSFFVIYANIDGFDPAAKITGPAAQLDGKVLASATDYRPIHERNELDRWIISELNRTAAAVVERMDVYDNFGACERLSNFVDALSNWYVRRSRDRFWSCEKSAAKLDGYWTLYECLLTTCKLIAPFTPFLAETMWRNLTVAAFAGRAPDKAPLESVHLCEYPTCQTSLVDEVLSERMALVREIVSLGRSARMSAKLKVRQPLGRVEVVLADETHAAWLEEHASLIGEELNVKQVEFIKEAERYITRTLLPDLKRLGPRLGPRLPELRKLLPERPAAPLLAELQAHGRIVFRLRDGEVILQPEDLQVRLQAKPGWTAAEGRSVVVVLSTELTPELIREGLARELVRAVQDRRKQIGCRFTDRIILGITTTSDELKSAVEQFSSYICGETLAVKLTYAPLSGVEPVEIEVGGHPLTLYLKVAETYK